jgi:hypothetical protein
VRFDFGAEVRQDVPDGRAGGLSEAAVGKLVKEIADLLQIVEVLELDTDGNLVTNPVFKWDAFTDKFVFSGKSHIFEKIEGQLGITQEAILKEMDNRSKFLRDLRGRGIKDYYEVVERIREYELNKLTGDHLKNR